ncbi:MAG: AIPR family protein [Acidobacteriia bacterium]|nr:AIPR family protein [Terriglobia bacterium]
MLLLRGYAPAEFFSKLLDAIRIMVFQSKSSLSDTGFKPDEIDKFGFFINDLLDMTNSAKTLQGKYTPQILSLMGAFKSTYLSVAQSFPALHIEFYYVTRGDGTSLNSAATASKNRVLAAVQRHRGKGNNKDSVSFSAIDTAQLLVYVRRRRRSSRTIKWKGQSIPIGTGYVGMVRLGDYFDFLKDESGDLDELIFESNVRGNQGRTSVNRQMRAALDAGSPPDFWQLNNGVTVTCASISPIDAYSLSVDDAQVVNGLQTSRQIFGHFSDTKDSKNDARVVLVKLIPVSDDAVRDKIIRATNNQNPIKASALLLTGEVHRDIEDLFKQHGLYYDRRPGFYKDQGKPIAEIVSFNEVTQAAIALLLHRPDDSRARPGDYVGASEGKKAGEKHKLLFRPRKASKVVELSAYLKCVLIVRKVETFLDAISSLDYGDRRNLLFYIAYYLSCKITGSRTPSVEAVFDIRSASLTQESLQDAFKLVNGFYLRLSKKAESRDVVAKGPDLLAALKKKLPKTKGANIAKPAQSKRIKDVINDAEFKW